MEKNTFTVINNEGKETTCQVLFTFDSDETHKSYIVYTDDSKDAAGNTQVFASIYKPNQDTTKLEPIESEKEWKMIEKILESIQEEVRKKQEVAKPNNDESGNEQ